MNRRFKRCFAVGCLVAAGWTGSHPLNGETDQMPRFTVRLFNYAAVPRATLARAVETTTDVFRRAGIELIWVDCPVAPGEVEKARACDQFDGTPWTHLKILPEKMAKRLGHGNDVFGAAFATNAFVFFLRVEEFSRRVGISESSALGHFMAHELGHVLLGPASHSSVGVMKADLLRADLRCAEKGMLGFSPDQAARMQAHLRQPTLAISSAPPAGSTSAPTGADYLDAAPAASPLP